VGVRFFGPFSSFIHADADVTKDIIIFLYFYLKNT